jgi:hypothetical protein
MNNTNTGFQTKQAISKKSNHWDVSRTCCIRDNGYDLGIQLICWSSEQNALIVAELFASLENQL